MLQFYNLKEQPFGTTPDPRYFYPLPAHREALASLICAFEYRVGFASIIAEPGLGKTTVLFDLLQQYEKKAATAFIFNTQCNAQALLRQIAKDLGLAPPQDIAEAHDSLKTYVAARGISQPVLVVIDEAQNLGDDALEAVRLLSDFETANCKLLHIVLSGQPQLADKLKRPNLLQLLQRITIIARLKRLSPAETAGYIQHRLQVAGRTRDLFAPAALARIAAQTQGVPRDINRVCFNALLLGCATQRAIIDEQIVDEVIADLQLPVAEIPRPALALVAPTESQTAASSIRSRPTAISPAKAANAPTIVQPAAVPRAAPAVAYEQHHPVTVSQRGPAVMRIAVPAGSPQARSLSSIAPPPPQSVSQARSSTPATLPRPAAQLLSQPRIRQWRHVLIPTLTTVVLFAAALSASWVYTTLGHASSPKLPPSASSPARGVPPSLSDNADAVAPSAQFSERPAEGTHTVQKQPSTVKSSAAVSPKSMAKSTSADGRAVPVRIEPRLIRKLEPQYPIAAKLEGIEGDVLMDVTVAEDGHVSDVNVTHGSPLLARAAAEAVRQWKYQPATLNGRRVAAKIAVSVAFVLNSSD